MKSNYDGIEQYLAYRNSDAFKNSEGGKFQKLIMDFQNKSGYKEILIGNMKILSSAYAAYLQKLEQANKKMLEAFPEAKKLYHGEQ